MREEESTSALRRRTTRGGFLPGVGRLNLEKAKVRHFLLEAKEPCGDWETCYCSMDRDWDVFYEKIREIIEGSTDGRDFRVIALREGDVYELPEGMRGGP